MNRYNGADPAFMYPVRQLVAQSMIQVDMILCKPVRKPECAPVGSGTVPEYLAGCDQDTPFRPVKKFLISYSGSI